MQASQTVNDSVSSDPRPRSAVSAGVGLAGMVGMLIWVVMAHVQQLDGPLAAAMAVAACGVPMVLWSVLVDKVHRHPTTGIDWTGPARPWGEVRATSAVKLIGLWGTWIVIGFFYALGRWYWEGAYLAAMQLLIAAIPALLLLSIPYVVLVDRRMREPRDGLWVFGNWLMRRHDRADDERLYDHVRAWGMKAFFTAFMISIVPGNWVEMIRWHESNSLNSPVGIVRWLIAMMFLFDVAFATVGYLLTCKPLDAHIRSANPYAAGWTAALICYPPFVLMGDGGPLNYHPGTAEWSYWLEGQPVALGFIGAMLVVLTAIYAWATIVFGLRFSNLTHRGIITHGPYAWTKHPAYVSKNLFWWLATMPLLTTGAAIDLIRATGLLLLVSGVYYWRARTEERHLLAAPDYVAYARWMERHGPIPLLCGWLRARCGMRPPAYGDQAEAGVKTP
jgi:isoprenylcysteine carboxyl methyltransferase (ICMT) family protein YpbQ